MVTSSVERFNNDAAAVPYMHLAVQTHKPQKETGKVSTCKLLVLMPALPVLRMNWLDHLLYMCTSKGPKDLGNKGHIGLSMAFLECLIA